jgi:hypothetical protein
MSYVVDVHEVRLKLETGRMGVGEMRNWLTYLYRAAVVGAAGGPYSRGQALARSIKTVGPILSADGVHGEVYTDKPYAASVEAGARVHNIFPKAAPNVYRFGDHRRPQLHFVWRGREVFTPHVPMSPTTIGRSHPGQHGKRFMFKALEKTAVRYNLLILPR